MTIRQKITAYLELIRWHKPIGSYLLLWPVLTALWMAAKGLPQASMLVIFIVGTFIMRSAGCIVNDLTDRSFDGDVERTKERPLVTGTVKVWEAYLLLFIAAAVALWLVLQLNPLAIILAIAAFVMTCIYPFMKRITYLPQAWLGLTFSTGILIAFAAESQTLTLTAWLLLLANTLITIAYDTQYAMVDRDDDLGIGLKSSAILFGQYDRLAIALLQIAAVLLWLLIGWLQHLNSWYYLGVTIATLLLARQQFWIRGRARDACFRAFLNNHYVLLAVFVGTFLSFCP